MRKILLIFSVAMFVVACASELDQTIESSSLELLSTKSSAKDIYRVTQQDVRDYVHYLSVHDDYKNNPVVSVKTYTKDGYDVFYIINLEKGWKVISADKRGPIVLAQSSDEQLDINFTNEGEKAWFESIADQIISRKKNTADASNDILKYASENEEKCINFWKVITGDITFLNQNLKDKRLLQNADNLEPSRIYTVDVLYESVDHLIPVYWHQNAPFNSYCPLKDSTSTLRCPAGCGPIAAAQVVYYLHYNVVYRPSYSPSSGSCEGWVDNYTQSFSNFNGSTWGNMSYSDDPYGYAALLIGYIGKETYTTYGPYASSTYPADLKNVFETQFGINCRYGYYDEDIAYSNIKSGLPVICVGYSSTAGHGFILDGYESHITETHYEFTLPSGNIVESVVLSDPYVAAFRINWGWGISGRNSTYAPNGSWNGYDNNRHMIYNFMSENK